VAFLTLFLCFFQLRVADEFKDYADDARYRPYRPVPRGLVSLQELGVLAIAAAAIQLGLAVSLGWGMVLLLLLLWGYIWLMRVEFCAPAWLKAHPVLYMLSHMVVMPLMALYASACFWLPAGLGLPATLGWFLLVSYCNGMVIEIGRKIRAPQAEETGVETYSALWGRPNAVAVWLAVMGGMAIATLLAARAIQFLPLVVLVLLPLLTAAMIVAWRFLSHPVARWAQGIEWISGLGTLLVYASVGILPLFLQYRL
jgi:4-hydroxybenzoate polyprenyltransferase